MKVIAIFLLCVAAAQAVRLGGASEDLLAQQGQCAYGLPRDGRFSKCELGDYWKIGRSHLAKPVKESDIMFTDDFSKLWKEDFTNSSEDSCSATIPGHAVLYQRLTDDILYAHYRLRACARVLGNTPCSVVVKTARNEIYDKLEFSPDADLTCSGSTSDCISECSSAIESISVRYVGALPAHVRIRSPDVGINDWVDAGDFKYGDEATYNLDNLAAWFNNTIDFFPDVELETTFGNNSKVIDVVYFNCSRLSVTPGQRLGDLKQFLVLSLSASEGDFCNWNDLARHRGNCTCENASAKEVCMYSDKGFVADPSEEFYIGLESGSCSCSFDNICLEQVNGDEGYFGLDWILHEEKKKEDNSTESDD